MMNQLNIVYSEGAWDRLKDRVEEYLIFTTELGEELDDHRVEFMTTMFLRGYRRNSMKPKEIVDWMDRDPEIHVVHGPVDNLIRDLEYPRMGLISDDKVSDPRIFRTDSPPRPIRGRSS